MSPKESLFHRIRRNKPLSRLLVLNGLLLVLLIPALILLPSDPLIAARLQSLLHPAPSVPHMQFNPDAQARFDLPLGIQMPEVSAGAVIRKQTPFSSKGYLVVGLGDCAACIRFDFAKWQRDAAKRHVPLIGFTSATQEQLAAYRRAEKPRVPIFMDKGNLFNTSLNSYWSGRVFYFDKDWRLRWRMEGFSNVYSLEQQPDLPKILKETT